MHAVTTLGYSSRGLVVGLRWVEPLDLKRPCWPMGNNKLELSNPGRACSQPLVSRDISLQMSLPFHFDHFMHRRD